MNTQNRTSLLKMAFLAGFAAISSLVSLPASAQNPHPTIFNEPPYNQRSGPPQKVHPGHRLGHHRLKPRSDQAQGLRRPPGDGNAPPDNGPRLRRPPGDGNAPAPQPDAPPPNRP